MMMRVTIEYVHAHGQTEDDTHWLVQLPARRSIVKSKRRAVDAQFVTPRAHIDARGRADVRDADCKQH